METNPGFDEWDQYDSDLEEDTMLDAEDLNTGPPPPPIDQHLDRNILWKDIHIESHDYQEQDD